MKIFITNQRLYTSNQHLERATLLFLFIFTKYILFNRLRGACYVTLEELCFRFITIYNLKFLLNTIREFGR